MRVSVQRTEPCDFAGCNCRLLRRSLHRLFTIQRTTPVYDTPCESEVHQFSVFIVKPIEAGVFLAEFPAKAYSANGTFQSHLRYSYKYLLDHDLPFVYQTDSFCLDARTKASELRFLRRSCVPNAELRQLMIHGKPVYALYSTRRIDESCGFEVTLPFEFRGQSLSSVAPCACTQSNCKVYVFSQSLSLLVSLFLILMYLWSVDDIGTVNDENQSCHSSSKLPRS